MPNFDFNTDGIKNKKISGFLENDISEKYYYTKKLKVYNKIKKMYVPL